MKQVEILILCSLILTSVIAGCSRKFKMPRESLARESHWQFHRSNIQNSGAADGTYNGALNVIWEQETGTRPSGPLTMGNDYLIYPGSRKKVRIYDAINGAYSGYVKTKGLTPTGMVLSDSLAYYVDGPRRYVLHCVNLLNRQAVWTVPVTDAAAGVIVLNEKIIVSLTDGTFLAFNGTTGAEDWRFKSKERLLAPPSANQMSVYQPGDKGTVFLVNAQNGSESSRIVLNEPILTSAAIDDFVYIVDMPGNVYALKSDSGNTVWKSLVTGPVWSAPAVARGIVCITSNAGELNVFDSQTGRLLWNYEANEVIYSSPIIVGDFVLFGTMTGKLYSLRAADGTLVAKREFTGAISQSPISDGQFIYVATDRGELVCLGDSQKLTSTADSSTK